MALDFPASPSNGQIFSSGGISWTFDGDKWKVSSSSIEPVFISSSTPTGVAGQIYWDSDESTAYIYYDDGNTAQWVPLVSTAPVSFDTSAIVSGTLPVARGGSGQTSYTNGELLIGNTTGNTLDKATLTAGSGISITNGNGSIEISSNAAADKIAEGNTEAEVVDTGTDGHFKVTTEGTERLRINNAGTATFTGEVQDSKGEIRAIPQNSQTSAYTLVAGDVGKHISITTGGVTIPSGVFSAGDAISIYNNSGSDQTITQGASVTLRLAGDGTTGNKTLALYGLCTVLCVASNEFVIAGTGLS